MTIIGERIKQLRTEKGLSQDDLAKHLNLKNRSTLGTWETSDKASPDYETLKRLAAFFNVSTDYLLGATDERTGKAEVTFKLTNGATINDLSEMLSQLSPDDQQLIFNMINSLIKKDKK